MKLFLDIANENIIQLLILTLLKPHILAFTTLLQTIWESVFAFNLWNNRKKRNITISILSGAGATPCHPSRHAPAHTVKEAQFGQQNQVMWWFLSALWSLHVPYVHHQIWQWNLLDLSHRMLQSVHIWTPWISLGHPMYKTLAPLEVSFLIKFYETSDANVAKVVDVHNDIKINIKIF